VFEGRCVVWRAFLCGLGAKNEEGGTEPGRKMGRVKERGGGGEALVPFLARPKPKIPFLGLSLL